MGLLEELTDPINANETFAIMQETQSMHLSSALGVTSGVLLVMALILVMLSCRRSTFRRL